MGCDIHMHIEYFDTHYKEDKKGKLTPIKKWRCADWFRLNKYYGKKGEPKYKQVPLWDDRDYNLFAILASVRNYNDIEPISEPRGIPHDISYEVLKELTKWGEDAHSISYLTLQELIYFVNNKKDSSKEMTFRSGMHSLIDLIDLMKVHVEIDNFIYDCELVDLYPNTFNDVRIVFWFDN